MTVVAIVAIMASLSYTVMVYGAGRARMNNTVFDVAAVVSTAQLRALSRGVPHYMLVFQDADGQVTVSVLERPDLGPAPIWDALDLTAGPEAALAFERTLPNGTIEPVDALLRDRVTMGVGSGPDSGGIAFMDLDSPRIRRPLPAPFNTIPLASAFAPANLNLPSSELLAGCSFCIAGARPYGVIRFNTNGTVQPMTGDAETGGTIAFMPNTTEESNFEPRLLTISAPAGAVRVF
jgi:hypothetical protein